MYNSGRRGRRASDGYGILSQADRFNQTEYPIPIVNSFAVTDGSYVPLDDTAASTAGGQTIVLYGSGFAPGATVTVGGVTIGAVTYLDQGRLTFTSPANSSGSYTIIVMNANGGTGILVPGLVYSGVPTWSTSAGSVGSVYETTNVSSTFVATGDAPVTYSVLSGSLPPGTSLSTTGVLTGSAPVESGSTTYSFTIRATDGQLQDSDRSFSLTVNTDVVSWSTPTNNQVISAYEYAPISNVTASATSAAGYGVVYSANAVPTGITVNANTGVISGTVNTVGNTFTRLTATANTTVRTAIRDVVFNINPDVVTWNSPADGTQYTLTGGSPISNVTLSATSAAGFGVQYTANTLPSGLTLSGSTISGTPNLAQTVNTLLTATANTTNRTATRTISWTISLGDLNWTNTTLALNAVTTVSPFITDSSNNNAQLIVGDSRASNFNPYQQGYYSLFNDGTGQNATVGSGSTAFNLTGDFTVEAWVYPTSFAGDNWGIIDARTAGASPTNWIFALEDQGTETYKIMFYSGAYNRSSGQTISANRWTHVAAVRNGSALRFFVNGVLDYHNGSFGTGALSPGSTTPVIGSKDSGISTYKTAGYISNLRLVNGTAVYTTSATTIGTSVFTPSTTPLTAVANTTLLTCQDNRYIDDSPNNFTITPGSASAIRISSGNPFSTVYQANTQYYSTYFDGTGDYLTTPTNAAFTYGTSDFTIEMWAYITANPGDYAYIYAQGPNSTASMCVYIQGGVFRVWNGSNIVTGSTSYSLNTWYHVALSRSGTSLKLFVNGVQDGSVTNSSNITTGTTYGGAISRWIEISDTRHFTGYVSNLRVVKGQALYTSSFTPPTAPLTAVANTSLLTCQSATLIDNSTNAFTITASGDTKPLAVSPFTPLGYTSTPITTYGSSYHLNPTRDASQIYTPTSALYNVSGDFTLEFWVNFNDTSTQQQELFRFDGASTYNPYLMLWSTNAFYFRTTEVSGDIVTNFASGITAGQWVHLCVTRSGNNYTIYRNGISVATGTSTGVANENKKLILGSGNFKGYLSGVRFTKGSVLYTSNFVPEFTRPLTAGANTQLLTVQTNGAHNNSTFKDESTFSLPITRNGNVTQGTFSPYGDNWSNYFDGNGDNLAVTSLPAPGTGAFTLEMWVNYNGSDGTRYDLFAFGGSAVLYKTTSNTLNWFIGSDRITTSFTTALYGGKWTHIALTRDSSNNTKMFINGTQVGSTYASDTNNYTVSGATIGVNSGGGYWLGYISNFRLINGNALYTTNFTPSTTPLTAVANTVLLTCQDNRLIDESPRNLTITKVGDVSVQKFSPFGTVIVPKYYSTFFDGTGDYLQTPASSTTTLIGGSGGISTTSTFTVEGWIYQTQRQTYDSGCMIGDMGTNGSIYWGFGPNATGKLAFNWFDGASKSAVGNTTIALNTWTHIALSISSGSISLFVNGVLQTITGTSTTTNQSGTFNYLLIGGFYTFGSAYGYYGYISNLRITRSALYTTGFTPSTTPLTAVANTSLLTCQNNTFVDNSTNNLLITAAGDSKPLAISPFTPTANTGLTYSPDTFGGSMYFDGTSDYLTVASNPAYTTLPASGNFTMEGWFYFTDLSIAQQLLFTQRSSTNQYVPYLLWTSTSSILLYVSSNNGSWDIVNGATAASGLVANQWYHFAYTRNGSKFRFFVNGIQTYTFTSSAAFTNTNTYNIGMSPGETNTAFKGYISDHRFINGVSLYNANFVPPTAPATPVVYSNNSTAIANTAYAAILVSGTSGGIVDAHATNILETVGDAKLAPEDAYSGSFYSNFFDGTGDYLTVPDNTALQMGSGDFTIEFWINYNSIAGYQTPYSKGYTAAGDLLLQTGNGDGKIIVYLSGTAVITEASSAVVGQWYHYALVRSGTAVTLYRNGVSVGTATSSVNFNTTNQLGIGATGKAPGGNSVGAFAVNGYMSNVRVVKGTAVYTTSFTPSTTPLTAISGTSLLTCQSNSLRDNSTNAFTITRNGDVAVKSFNPFKRNTGQSIYFDGVDDYLSVTHNPNQQLGTGDFTAEGWFMPMSGKTDAVTCFYIKGINTSGGIILGVGSSYIFMRHTGSTDIYSPNYSNDMRNQWVHVAWVRSGSTVTIYRNGVSVATGTVSINQNDSSTVYIGSYTGIASSSNRFGGYAHDFRITKGVARYTTNFTPPTTTFEVK